MRHLASLIFVGSSLVAGCVKSSSGADVDSAASAVDSSDSVESEGNVMMAMTDGADMTGVAAITSDQAATRIADNVALRWNPSGCATATVANDTVTVKLNNCTGPRGLVHVTGELDLVVTVSGAGQISVHGTASNLEVNSATLDVDIQATYAVTGTSHSLTVQTQGSGTGPRGNAIDHNGDYTISWDTGSQCGSIVGMWSTELTGALGSATRSNDVNLMRCAGGCPTGSLVHHFLGGASLTVTYNGTSTAQWQLSTGRSGTINLLCH